MKFVGAAFFGERLLLSTSHSPKAIPMFPAYHHRTIQLPCKEHVTTRSEGIKESGVSIDWILGRTEESETKLIRLMPSGILRLSTLLARRSVCTRAHHPWIRKPGRFLHTVFQEEPHCAHVRPGSRLRPSQATSFGHRPNQIISVPNLSFLLPRLEGSER